MKRFTSLMLMLLCAVTTWAQLTTGQYYKIKNVDAGLYLNVVNDNANMQLRKESASVLQLFQLEEATDGKYYIKSVKGETTYYVHASGWNFNATTTADNKTPYTINLVEGETDVYSLQQTTSNYTGYAGADATAAGSPVYCNKGNAVGWTFEAVTVEEAALETGKQYRLRSDLSGLYMQCVNYTQTSGEGAYQLKTKSPDAGQIFELEDAGENKFYLKNVNEETTYYVKAESWNFYASTEATTPFTIELLDDEYSVFSIFQNTALEGYAGNTDNSYNAADGTKIYCNQPNLTGCTTWFFEEVNDEVVSITYVYKYNDTEVTRETLDAIVGAEFPEITVPFGFTATKPEGVVESEDGDAEFIVVLTENLPFEYASDVQSIENWYFMKMHPDYPTFVQENNGILPYVENNSVATDDTRNTYAWAFVGDPLNGFKLVNKATGNVVVSTGNNDDDVTTTADFANGTLLKVCASTARTNTSFFTLKPVAGGSYLNANAPAGKLKHWSNPDGGSTITLIDYTAQADVTFNWTAADYETIWGSALALEEYPAVTVNVDANGANVHRTETEITTTGARTLKAKFQYTSGSCALQLLGVEILNLNGDVIAADYHKGSTGNNSSNNIYTVKVSEAGTYTVRCYVWANANERLNDTNGTVTVAFYDAEAGDFSHDVTFAADYATLHLGYKVAVPEGVEAYVVSATNATWATLEQVNNVIPAATPVILKKTGTATTYNFYYTSDEADEIETNLLEGSIADRYVAADAYVLGINNEEVGLYTATKNQLSNTAFKNNANKAYLPKTAGMNAASYSFRFGEGTTGIDQITENREQSTAIFDLTGRRVEAISAPGIYIINGKKVLVK
ncbi:MAG: RICIN domain-containing protein [Bacteroidaceae bacterium]|nr:RICIN domain-containing protein [Bacteroidaceae bacterium]